MVKANVNLFKYNPSSKIVKTNVNLLKYLVLDLDHTLIYCKKIRTKKGVRCQFILRPHLFKFLNNLKEYYILNIFTGATEEYGNKVFKKIKGKTYSFFKRLCSNDLENGEKKMDKILKDETRIILIDDNKKYIDNKKNAIIIKPFFGNKNDNVLPKLEKILIDIHDRFIDVTKGIKVYKNDIKNINK